MRPRGRREPSYPKADCPGDEAVSGQAPQPPRADEPCVLAVDPGRAKCGLAVVGPHGVLERSVVLTEKLADEALRLASRYLITHAVVGDRTASADAARAIEAALPSLAPSTIIDEKGSTVEGRKRYFLENPPRGWRKFVPQGLLTPPVPYDDYVAVVLAERFLKSLELPPLYL